MEYYKQSRDERCGCWYGKGIVTWMLLFFEYYVVFHLYCDDGCLLMELKYDRMVNCAWVRVRVGFGKCGVVLVPVQGV